MLILLAAALAVALLYRPGEAPPLWFDEGWTLSVARNLIEKGQYARFLGDQPIAAPGMAWTPPVTLPVALSFSIFGVGAWQGRLPGALAMTGALLLTYWLAFRFYGQRIATATLALLILTAVCPFPPMLLGRQAIAEPVMLFGLLAGYGLFLLALERRSWVALFAAAVFWGVAFSAKNHAFPFWLASMVVIFGLAVFRRDGRTLLTTFVVGAASFAIWQLIVLWEAFLYRGLPLYGAPMRGLFQVTVFVPQLDVRLEALQIVAIYGLPALLGYLYAACFFWRTRSQWRTGDISDWPVYLVRLAFFVMVGSWFVWYLALAVAWVRYLFPATFLGAMYLAVLLERLTAGFDWRKLIERMGRGLRTLRFDGYSWAALAAVLILTYLITLNILVLSMIYAAANDDAFQTAAYLNQIAPPDALVETFDGEMVFLLDRPCHFPPDQIQVELNQRVYLGQDAPINYQPLDAEPEYLVVGPYSRLWGLYTSILVEGNFRLVYERPTYQVYQRSR